MGTHNGQGLGIHDGGKLTAIISDGGGSQFGMVGSEWLTRVPILLQTVTIILLFICLKSGNLYCKLIKELYEF